MMRRDPRLQGEWPSRKEQDLTPNRLRVALRPSVGGGNEMGFTRTRSGRLPVADLEGLTLGSGVASGILCDCG